MFGLINIFLENGIVVNIVEFLQIEFFIGNKLGLIARFPDFETFIRHRKKFYQCRFVFPDRVRKSRVQ